MKEYSEILSKKYNQELFNNILRNSESTDLMPLTDINKGASNIDEEYFENIFNGLLNHLANLDKPLYTSRQEFLKYAYLDENGSILFHLKNEGESSTLMGGSKEDDPFYDPNWKTAFYTYGDNSFSRIRKNLISRFFIGINSNFYNSNNKKYYVKTISLKDVSIEEFNKLFTPFKNDDGSCNKEEYISYFKDNIEVFLDKIIITEELEENDSDEKIEKETKDKKYTDILNSFSRDYLDENGNSIKSEPVNAQYNSMIEVNEILTFAKGDNRIITKINVLNNPIKGHYLEIHTKKEEYNQEIFTYI